jgi:hypothetical protein
MRLIRNVKRRTDLKVAEIILVVKLERRENGGIGVVESFYERYVDSKS